MGLGEDGLMEAESREDRSAMGGMLDMEQRGKVALLRAVQLTADG